MVPTGFEHENLVGDQDCRPPADRSDILADVTVGNDRIGGNDSLGLGTWSDLRGLQQPNLNAITDDPDGMSTVPVNGRRPKKNPNPLGPVAVPPAPPVANQQPQGNPQCLKAFFNGAPTTTPVDAPTATNPLVILGTALAALLSGDTPKSQRPSIYYHYGFASQASQFAGGIRPGGYGTPDLVILSGSSAQQIYALPPQNSIDSPPDARYTITVPPGVPVQNLGPVGPTTFPGPVNPTGDNVTRTGGGNEVLFPKGTPPGSVSAPQSLPPC
jgi:hypothetical protein